MKDLKAALMSSRPTQEIKPMTGIIQDQEDGIWKVWYKGVMFAELVELADAHDRLQKLLGLDSIK